jgi:fibro-slime domain-containing protein
MKVWWSIFALFTAAAVGCGGFGRTELDDAEPCLPTDTMRACTDVCGAGTSACAGGFWQPCVVPPTTLPCTGACGGGVQQCVDSRLLACTRDCSTVCGDGTETCANDKWGACTAPIPKPPTLHAVVRDFHATHADFESPITGEHPDPGIVQAMLGPDDKPVYAGNPTTPTTSGADSFDQWYNDVPGQNESTMIDLKFTGLAPAMSQAQSVPGMQPAGSYAYDQRQFFPIDGQLFGDEGNPHNFHFTAETHTRFTYVAGATLSFTSDDDGFVFVNRQLAIDLGGVHSALSGTVNLDASAASLGITPGQMYQLDIFYAERHTFGATFVIDTNIADVSSCE